MEQNGSLIAAGIFLLVLVPFFVNAFSKRKKHTQICGNTINYDSALKEFWFISPRTRQQLLAVLETPGIFENYAYTFDSETMCLTFCHELTGYTASCVVFLEPQKGGTRIRLIWIRGRLDAPKAGTRLLFSENVFCHDVLQATPVPYDPKKL